MPLRTCGIFNVRHERSEKPKSYRSVWNSVDLDLELVKLN
jgi:hypothetical protein